MEFTPTEVGQNRIDYPSWAPQVTGPIIKVTGYLSWQAFRRKKADQRANSKRFRIRVMRRSSPRNAGKARGAKKRTR